MVLVQCSRFTRRTDGNDQSIRVIGQIDRRHRLTAKVPATVAPGPVEVLVLVPAEPDDEAGEAWIAGIAREWGAELSDPREDLYSLADGEPVDAAG
jgi:hypothetical protein